MWLPGCPRWATVQGTMSPGTPHGEQAGKRKRLRPFEGKPEFTPRKMKSRTVMSNNWLILEVGLEPTISSLGGRRLIH